MWNWLDKYFTVTAGERKAITIILALLPLTIAVPVAYRYFFPPAIVRDENLQQDVTAFLETYNQAIAQKDSADSYAAETPDYNPYAEVNTANKKVKKDITYFTFDPNQIGINEWMLLGFSEKQAKSIEAYKSKGGKFYRPEDLKKLYVVSEKDYERLLPYVSIASARPISHKQENLTPKIFEKPLIDINEADSSLLERQRGIGPYTARRIINYRNRLGGFHSKEQLKEVWGFPDSTYRQLQDRLVVSNTQLVRININTADVAVMGKHPYINFKLAKIIYNYRGQHGVFKKPEDLLSVPEMNDSIFRKMRPYIAVE